MAEDTTLVDRYEALPEWLRWLICWPISGLFAVGFWWLLVLIAVVNPYGVGPLFNLFVRLGRPVAVHVLFLVAIYATVPRGKLGFVLTFIVLRSLLLAFYAVTTLLLLLDVFAPPQQITMNWEYWWAPFLGEVFTLIGSIATYKAMREQH